MNIWCISKYANLPKYGAGARLFYLTREFLRLGHNACLITSDANHLAKFPTSDTRYNYEYIDEVPVCWIKTKKYTKTASFARVLSWLDFERWLFTLPPKKFSKPDVVIISSLSIFSIVYGWYLKKKYQSFLVFEVRDIWPLTMTAEGGFSQWHPLVMLIGAIEKFGYKHSDLIVGTMPRLDMHVKKILGYERPFFCSPLGFNPEDYVEELVSHSNPFDIYFPKNKVIVGYAGSMGITNALESFIEIIKILDREITNIHFVLVGSGDLRSEFEEQLAGSSNVTFLPRIPQNQVQYFLHKCDILYLSTKDSEVWEYGQSMNKIVEYMLAGKPIVASYAGYQSMINEAKCGSFVQPNKPSNIRDAIMQIASLSDRERSDMGQKGRDWIYSNRTYISLAEEYIDAIMQIKK